MGRFAMRTKAAPRTRKARARAPSLERVAFHEAGHAVVAHLLRRKLTRVSIVPSEEFLGFVGTGPLGTSFDPELDMNGRARRVIEREAQIFLAGNAAESVLVGHQVRHGMHHDFEQVVQYLSYVTGTPEEGSAYADWLWVRTRNMVKMPANWNLITALSGRLLDRREMQGREVGSFLVTTERATLAQGIPQVLLPSAR
jgi:hypothetical protein